MTRSPRSRPPARARSATARRSPCRSIMEMDAAPADAAASDRRSEESLIRSLAELRAIELQRQTDEQAAAEAAVQARRREREAAAQAARDAEAARLAAEHEAHAAAERAHAAAEREARLQIEALEAAE